MHTFLPMNSSLTYREFRFLKFDFILVQFGLQFIFSCFHFSHDRVILKSISQYSFPILFYKTSNFCHTYNAFSIVVSSHIFLLFPTNK